MKYNVYLFFRSFSFVAILFGFSILFSWRKKKKKTSSHIIFYCPSPLHHSQKKEKKKVRGALLINRSTKSNIKTELIEVFTFKTIKLCWYFFSRNDLFDYGILARCVLYDDIEIMSISSSPEAISPLPPSPQTFPQDGQSILNNGSCPNYGLDRYLFQATYALWGHHSFDFISFASSWRVAIDFIKDCCWYHHQRSKYNWSLMLIFFKSPRWLKVEVITWLKDLVSFSKFRPAYTFIYPTENS